MACSKLCPKIETELKFVTVSECRNRVAESFQISSHVVARGVISTASHDAFCGWKQLLCSPTRQRERHGYLLRGSSCPFPPLNSSERKRERETGERLPPTWNCFPTNILWGGAYPTRCYLQTLTSLQTWAEVWGVQTYILCIPRLVSFLVGHPAKWLTHSCWQPTVQSFSSSSYGRGKLPEGWHNLKKRARR